MIACRDAVERLWSYLDRNIDGAQEDELESIPLPDAGVDVAISNGS
jgi:hypothetical protein